MDKEAIPRWEKDQIERDIKVYHRYKVIRNIERLIMYGLGVLTPFLFLGLWRLAGA